MTFVDVCYHNTCLVWVEAGISRLSLPLSGP